MPDGVIRHSFSPGWAGMVSWRMPDGTEIVCVGIPVEADKLREFVVRFMGAAGAGWNLTGWREPLFGSAFEERLAREVVVRLGDGGDAGRVFAIGRVPNDEPGSFNLAP